MLPSVRGAGFHMISEKTIPVLRVDGPSGSWGLITVATTALAGVVSIIQKLRRGRLAGIVAGHGQAEINLGRHRNGRRAQLRPVSAVVTAKAGEHIADAIQPQPGIRIIGRKTSRGGGQPLVVARSAKKSPFMPGVASAAAKGLPDPGWRGPSNRPRPKGRTNPARPGDQTSKLPVLELIFKIELIAGAADVIAGAADVHAIGRDGDGGRNGRIADVLRV